jgi:hypothetical protein
MTHFEFIAVAVSIILGLGVIQLLSNLDQVLARPRRYWLHSAWVFMMFWILVQNWWAFWDLRDVAWNIGYFSLWIAYVSVLYLTVLTLTKTNSTELSWEEVYFSRSRRIFGLLVIVGVLAVFLTWIMLEASLLHPYRYIQYSSIGIFTFLFTSKRKRLHEVFSVLVIAIVLLGQGIFRLQPGLFGNAV